jgi:hypothetical protein
VKKMRPVKPPNRRGSPEAIEKRRAARFFNDVLGGRSAGQRLDGRTQKRRERLLRELETGKARGTRDLKPLDVLLRVQELLELGEGVSALRKVVKVKKTGLGEDIPIAITRLHKAYNFRPEVYRFVGIGEDVLKEVGVIAEKRPRGDARAAAPKRPPRPRAEPRAAKPARV